MLHNVVEFYDLLLTKIVAGVNPHALRVTGSRENTTVSFRAPIRNPGLDTGFRRYDGSTFVLIMAGLLLGSVLLAAPRNGSALTLTEVIAATQNVYDKTNDLKADFIQETTIKSINKTEREEGVFYFKKPHRMVWAYTKPKDKKMVINPQTAWLYLPVDNVVYIQNAAEVFKGKAIIRFLSGWGKLTEDFTVTFASPEGVDRSGNFHLRLAPREQDFGVTAFFLILDKSKFQITQLNFTDSYGNTTRLSFRDIRVNINLPEKLFTFKPPAGVEIQK